MPGRPILLTLPFVNNKKALQHWHLVGQGSGVGSESGNAGNVDDAFDGRLFEVRDAKLGQLERGLHVDVHGKVERFRGQRQKAVNLVSGSLNFFLFVYDEEAE